MTVVSPMSRKLRNILLILAGALPLVLLKYYSGPFQQWLHSYGKNVTVSFSLYFLLQFLRLPGIHKRLANGGYALFCVFAEELAERASLYPGVFDPFDFLYDAIGVAAAMAIDAITSASAG